jgi:hypothetical protein
LGYVRLKHTLSALALEALEHPDRRVVVGWLAAYCDAVEERTDGARFWQPLSALGARRRATNAGDPIAMLFDWTDGTMALRAEFQPYVAYMHRQVHRLQAALRTLRVGARAGRRGPDQTVMRRAAALFNHGLFFECHEFLEDVWRAAPAAERGFYHGVILIAAAFYHHEKGNLHGTRVKLKQGIAYLQPYLPRAHGVRVDRWMHALAPWRERVDAGRIAGVIAQNEIPRIP